jgi:hypothetical protein
VPNIKSQMSHRFLGEEEGRFVAEWLNRVSKRKRVAVESFYLGLLMALVDPVARPVISWMLTDWKAGT